MGLICHGDGEIVKKVEKTKGWVSVSIPMEYLEYIFEALEGKGGRGCVSEFVRDAVMEKLAASRISTPKYETLFERYELIME